MEKIKPLSYENRTVVEENESKTNDMIYIKNEENVLKDFNSKRSKNSYNSPKCFNEEQN